MKPALLVLQFSLITLKGGEKKPAGRNINLCRVNVSLRESSPTSLVTSTSALIDGSLFTQTGNKRSLRGEGGKAGSARNACL